MTGRPTSNAVELTIAARKRDLGGFEVGRVLPSPRRRMVGPFIFFDHLGPRLLAAPVPRSVDVRPHPHIGLATITYLFEGELTHRDSLGVEQVIRPGEVNWMTAGRGISHSERFDGMRASGGMIHGLQAWVALPAEREESEPNFEHYGGGELAVIERPGVSLRVIAGRAFGAESRVRTCSPLVYAHLEMGPGATIIPEQEPSEQAIYVVDGEVTVDGHRVDRQTMAVFAARARPTLQAVRRSIVMLLGGEPVGARHIWWNFVSSRAERIEQAKVDWTAGRIPLPPADSEEFTPLPEGL